MVGMVSVLRVDGSSCTVSFGPGVLTVEVPQHISTSPLLGAWVAVTFRWELLELLEAGGWVLDRNRSVCFTSSMTAQPTSRPPYAELFAAARADIPRILKGGARLTSSAIYAKIDYGSKEANRYQNINVGIYALQALISEGLVTDEHEMVDGYISTHFHSMASEPVVRLPDVPEAKFIVGPATEPVRMRSFYDCFEDGQGHQWEVHVDLIEDADGHGVDLDGDGYAVIYRDEDGNPWEVEPGHARDVMQVVLEEIRDGSLHP